MRRLARQGGADLRARPAVGRGGLLELALRRTRLEVEHAAQRVNELLHLAQLWRAHLSHIGANQPHLTEKK